MNTAVPGDPPSTAGKPLASGRTAEVYPWRDGQVLKLFLTGTPVGDADHEYRISTLVAERSPDAPRVGDRVEVQGRWGIAYERIEGPSLLAALSSGPWRLVSLARQMARLHSAIHRQDGAGLPRVHAALERCIQRAQGLPAEIREAALATLGQLDDSNSLCHGDFHPDNILLSPRGPVAIDWTNAVCGPPLADVARTSLMLRIGPVPQGNPRARLIDACRALFHRTYLREYLRLHPAAPTGLNAWLLPVAAARWREKIHEERPALLALLENLTSGREAASARGTSR